VWNFADKGVTADADASAHFGTKKFQIFPKFMVCPHEQGG